MLLPRVELGCSHDLRLLGLRELLAQLRVGRFEVVVARGEFGGLPRLILQLVTNLFVLHYRALGGDWQHVLGLRHEVDLPICGCGRGCGCGGGQ